MTKVKTPLLSFTARRKLGDDIVFVRRRGVNVVEARPVPPDARSQGQLSWRHMFQKVINLWHALSAAEKEAWESLGRRRHMTGYAWFVSQALRPNPGIYLPLQGGVMQGDIDMAAFKIEDLPDPALAQDADTKAARDAAIAAALAGSLHCDIYGYDGANWQTLLVESAAQKNLRVRLYDGVSGVNAYAWNAGAIVPTGKVGLMSLSSIGLRYDDGLYIALNEARIVGDGNTLTGALPVGAWVWNGSSWDRLRSYPTGILKVGRSEIGLSTLRRIGAGQVKASSGNLYWMNLNPSAGLSAFELSDDLDGSGAVVLDHFDTTRDGHMITFDPPMEFSTGIYLKTLTNMTSITFGFK